MTCTSRKQHFFSEKVKMQKTKYCAHLHHTLAALKRDFPASLVAPLPNSEQTNLTSSNHTYTTSTPNHIYHHYAPCATLPTGGWDHWQDRGDYFFQLDPTLDTGCIFINKYITLRLKLASGHSHAAIHKVSIIWLLCDHTCGHRDPKKHQYNLRLNKLATLGANKLEDAFNLKSDSENLAKSKLEFKKSALYLLPKKVMDFQSLKKSPSRHASASGGVWSKFQVTISQKRHGLKS